MPETPPGDSRKLILIVVAAALLVSWITIGTIVGYAHLPPEFIGGMVAFDLAVLYFLWRVLGPRGRS